MAGKTFSRPDYASWVGATFEPDPLFDDDAMEFGQLVRSWAVIGAGVDLPSAASPLAWAGQPGTRAPHLWIESDGEKRSTLDLFGKGFVLLTQDAAWAAASRDLAIEIIVVGKDVFPADEITFQQRFGLGRLGASLVRPDGIVAWRSADSADAATLRSIYSQVVSEVVP